MKAIGYITTYLVLAVFGALLNGWAIEKLWRWLIVPTFRLSPLTVAQCIGLALFVGYLTHQTNAEDSEKSHFERLCFAIGVCAVKPAIALLIGAIVRNWI